MSEVRDWQDDETGGNNPSLALLTEDASIRVLAETIASAPFPMFILAGPERRMIYNDAYRAILGPHHPHAMGQPFFQIWPEVRESVGPVIERAFAGEASLFEDMRVTLHRPDPSPAWFTFSYSPIRGETGAVVAALCICSETTEAVTARLRQAFLIDLETALRRLDDAFDIVEAAQSALGRYLGASRVGYGTLDPSERFFTTARNWTDGTVPHHNGTHDLAAFGSEIFGSLRAGVALCIDDCRTDPRAAHEDVAAAFAALEMRSALTVSLIKDGRFVAALYVHDRKPRRWTGEQLALVRDVAERTWSAVERAFAQAELRALAHRQAFLLQLSDQLRPLAQAEQVKEVAARLLGEHLQVGRAGYGEIDAEQKHVTVERDWNDGVMGSLEGETRPLDVFGPAIIAQLRAGHVLRLDSVADNEVSAPYAAGYDSIGTKSLLVVPLIKEGRFVAILYLHEAQVRAWSDAEADLAAEVAERTWSAVERARAENEVRLLNATLEERVNKSLAERSLYASIVEATDSPIQMIDLDYRFLAINPAAQADYERVFGVRPTVGQSLTALLDHMPDQREGALSVWNRALAGEAFDQLGWWGDGMFDRRAYEMRFRPVRDASGRVTGAYLIGRDVTELLQEQERLAAAEEQLRQAQKMEAIGQLTGGVAHDFNNLLTPIVGSLDILQRKQLGGEREQRMISNAAQAAERARVLVQRLLAFARRQPLQPTSVDLGELVGEMAQLIESTVGPQIHVAAETAGGLPMAQADRNQLEMALLNLAVNARDAMPDGGTLMISVRASADGEALPSDLRPGRYLRLSVADTGTGMDEQVLKRAIEPFFSTKGDGKGTGLGLSMVHGLALQSGGALTIETRRNIGTEVALWLPISTGTVSGTSAAAVAALPTPMPARGLALLVDDEALVRMSVAEMLHDLGYETVEADSAQEALARIEAGLRPDLLVTDHLMPGMTGTELARTVRTRHPNLQILIVSGFSEVDEIAPDLPRLTKPFRKDELARALGSHRSADGA